MTNRQKQVLKKANDRANYAFNPDCKEDRNYIRRFLSKSELEIMRGVI